MSDYRVHRAPGRCPFCEDAGQPDGWLSWEDMSPEHRRHHAIDLLVGDDPPRRPLTPAEQAWWDEEIRQRYTPS